VKYWDTSALVPLFIDQPHSPAAKEIFGDDPEAVLAWATWIEYESALQRAHREAILDEEGVAVARESFTLVRESAVEIQPSEELRARAIRLLAEHPLRAADALQLASALMWTGENPSGSGFVSFDDRLRKGAEGEGFTILPALEA
jgi:hypothetical protein